MSITSQTQPGAFGRHPGEDISIYKLLGLQGLQHLPKLQAKVASKFDFESSNIFCWRLLKDTLTF